MDENQNEQKRAMDKALHYLGYRARSVAQMKSYLEKKEFSKETIDFTVDKLLNYGYLNDEEFARRLTESNAAKGLGKRVIKGKLYKSGIDALTSQSIVDELNPEQEREKAQAWAEKIWPKLKDEDIRKRKQKLFRRLISKGFAYDIVNDILHDLDKIEENGDGDTL